MRFFGAFSVHGLWDGNDSFKESAGEKHRLAPEFSPVLSCLPFVLWFTWLLCLLPAAAAHVTTTARGILQLQVSEEVGRLSLRGRK